MASFSRKKRTPMGMGMMGGPMMDYGGHVSFSL